MKTRKYSVKLIGESPLLMKHDNIEWADKMLEYQKDPKNKKEKKTVAGDDRTPAWRWVGCLYINDKKIVIPSDNLMTLIREGGAKCPTGKGQTTFKRQSQSGIVVDQIAWPLIGINGEIKTKKIEELIGNESFSEHEEAVKELGFSLFVKRAVVNGKKHIRVRPRFDTWSTYGSITVLDNSITDQVVRDIFSLAGAYCGLCDWRPSSKYSPGMFGKFTAEIKKM